jgi:uncharacterized cupin superfamily protein
MSEATRKPKVLWKASELAQRGHSYMQQLNPASTFSGASLSRLCGLARAHVSLARVPPGKDSFAYHAHLVEEEWVYVLSGQGLAEIDGEEHPVGPGDFMGFATPSVPHLLKNRGTEDLVYLMGGESCPVDVVEYPHLGKRYVLVKTPTGTDFHELGPPERPFVRKPGT